MVLKSELLRAMPPLSDSAQQQIGREASKLEACRDWREISEREPAAEIAEIHPWRCTLAHDEPQQNE